MCFSNTYFNPISSIKLITQSLIVSSDILVGSKPVSNNLSTFKKVFGTSPAHPLFPPVYSIFTFPFHFSRPHQTIDIKQSGAHVRAEWVEGRCYLKILSNLADRRIARARAVWKTETIGGPEVGKHKHLELTRFGAQAYGYACPYN